MKNSFVLLLLLAVIDINSAEKEKEFNLNFYQDDYELKYERTELIRFNKDYITEMSLVTFKYNRTQAVCNFIFMLNVDIGNDLVWVVQAYKFMSNEYRHFPIRFAANFCKALAADVGGCRRSLTSGNFTGCPLLKGIKYHICRFHPDQKKLPPFIPNGSYNVEMQAVYFSTEIFVLNNFVTVSRQIPIP